MTRSKASRRAARNRAAMSIPYARMRPTSNWVVGSQALTSTGQVLGGLSTPTSTPTFDARPSGGTLLAAGTPVTYQAAVISPGLSNAVPTIGRMRVDEIKGHIGIQSANPFNSWVIAIGIYVSEFTQNTSAWDVYDPTNPSDAARDDWWFLMGKCIQVNSDGNSALNITAATSIDIDISVKLNLVLGGGQALNVTVGACSDGNAGTLFIRPLFRTRVGPVA